MVVYDIGKVDSSGDTRRVCRSRSMEDQISMAEDDSIKPSEFTEEFKLCQAKADKFDAQIERDVSESEADQSMGEEILVVDVDDDDDDRLHIAENAAQHADSPPPGKKVTDDATDGPVSRNTVTSMECDTTEAGQNGINSTDHQVNKSLHETVIMEHVATQRQFAKMAPKRNNLRELRDLEDLYKRHTTLLETQRFEALQTVETEQRKEMINIHYDAERISFIRKVQKNIYDYRKKNGRRGEGYASRENSAEKISSKPPPSHEPQRDTVVNPYMIPLVSATTPGLIQPQQSPTVHGYNTLPWMNQAYFPAVVPSYVPMAMPSPSAFFENGPHTLPSRMPYLSVPQSSPSLSSESSQVSREVDSPLDLTRVPNKDVQDEPLDLSLKTRNRNRSNEYRLSWHMPVPMPTLVSRSAATPPYSSASTAVTSHHHRERRLSQPSSQSVVMGISGKQLHIKSEPGEAPTSTDQHQAASRKRRSSRRDFLGKEAVEVLERWYNDNKVNPYPTETETNQLAEKSGLSLKQIKKWFANKRVRTYNTLTFNGCVHPVSIQRERAKLYNSPQAPQAGQGAQESPTQGGQSEDNLPRSSQSASRSLGKQASWVLSTWYEEHANNPYPSEEEKSELARQAGIHLRQVNCWFANKRNRTNNTRKRSMEEISFIMEHKRRLLNGN